MTIAPAYAGIGSRRTPEHVLLSMKNLATVLEANGWKLRSGGATGADQAFSSGVRDPLNKEIFLRHHATPDSISLAEKFHPAWDRCSEYVRSLHGRNMMILLGADLGSPVDMVVCWTQNGSASGGTGQALRAAKYYGISVYNLFLDDGKSSALSHAAKKNESGSPIEE